MVFITVFCLYVLWTRSWDGSCVRLWKIILVVGHFLVLSSCRFIIRTGFNRFRYFIFEGEVSLDLEASILSSGLGGRKLAWEH